MDAEVLKEMCLEESLKKAIRKKNEQFQLQARIEKDMGEWVDAMIKQLPFFFELWRRRYEKPNEWMKGVFSFASFSGWEQSPSILRFKKHFETLGFEVHMCFHSDPMSSRDDAIAVSIRAR